MGTVTPLVLVLPFQVAASQSVVIFDTLSTSSTCPSQRAYQQQVSRKADIEGLTLKTHNPSDKSSHHEAIQTNEYGYSYQNPLQSFLAARFIDRRPFW